MASTWRCWVTTGQAWNDVCNQPGEPLRIGAGRMSWTVDRTYGCWLWSGNRDRRDGRPLVWRGKTPIQAHIAVYRDRIGEVPDGLVLDHSCNRIECVAPHHLEPVTQRENLFRKSWRYRSKLERCKAGHDMKLNSVVVAESNGRVCRQCNRDANGG